MRTWRQRLCAGGLALVLAACAGPVAMAAGSYIDVPEGHWAAPYVEQAAQYHLMEGMGDGTFGMGQTLTRGQFAAALRKFFQWELVSPEEAHFSDVDPGQWYYPEVETALAHGVLTDEGDRFRPEEPITRQEMAELLVKALGFGELAEWADSLECPFSDVTEGKGYISLAFDFGMVNGTGDGRFNPGGTATREEVAAILVRVYQRYSSRLEWLHGFYAVRSYEQLGLTADMDGVSLGWATLRTDETGAPVVTTHRVDYDTWYQPEDSHLVTDYLEEQGVPGNLAIIGTDTAAFSTPEAREAAAAAIAAAAEGYAGVTMDIEGLKADSREAYTALMTQLRQILPEEQTLYVCVQPDTWFDGFDYRALGELCDKVILMAHDFDWAVPEYYVGTDRTENPGAPLTKVYDSLRDITDPETGVQDRSKIALAISVDSVGMAVDETGLLTGTTVYHPAPSTVIQRLRQEDTTGGYSALYGTSYIYYHDEEGSRYRLWYEDALSARAKISLARMFGINGISLWRLGNIPNYEDEGLNYDMWSAILAER